ncbi:MAG: cupin domain-containing protein [Pseudomonadota bacterium]
MKYLVPLNPRDMKGEFTPFSPEKVIRGDMAQLLDEREGAGKSVISIGTWASSEGAISCQYDEDELCVIAAGRVRLTNQEGESAEFGPGDGFLILNGFRGVWDSLEPLRKWYVIYK